MVYISHKNGTLFERIAYTYSLWVSKDYFIQRLDSACLENSVLDLMVWYVGVQRWPKAVFPHDHNICCSNSIPGHGNPLIPQIGKGGRDGCGSVVTWAVCCVGAASLAVYSSPCSAQPSPFPDLIPHRLLRRASAKRWVWGAWAHMARFREHKATEG